MATSVLLDPDEHPCDEILAARLGRAYPTYQGVIEALRSGCPESATDWKFYRDGKCWLMKASSKGKTVFWLSAADRFFTVTFYLHPRDEDALMASAIPESAKQHFRASQGKKFRGASLELRTRKDLSAFRELLNLKVKT